VDVILVLVSLGIVIWALSALLSPPKKHKEFSLHDRDQATIRGLGEVAHLIYQNLSLKRKK
jgi:hypothetical protein